MSNQIKFAFNSTDVRIAYTNGRAVATIIKDEDGNYRVVKMYDGQVQDCKTYTEARAVALESSIATTSKRSQAYKEQKAREAMQAAGSAQQAQAS